MKKRLKDFKALFVASFSSCPPYLGTKAGAVLRFFWTGKRNEGLFDEPFSASLNNIQIEKN